MLANHKFISRDDARRPRAHRDPSPRALLRIIFDFYYAVKMREFLHGPRARLGRSSRLDPRADMATSCARKIYPDAARDGLTTRTAGKLASGALLAVFLSNVMAKENYIGT